MPTIVQRDPDGRPSEYIRSGSFPLTTFPRWVPTRTTRGQDRLTWFTTTPAREGGPLLPRTEAASRPR